MRKEDKSRSGHTLLFHYLMADGDQKPLNSAWLMDAICLLENWGKGKTGRSHQSSRHKTRESTDSLKIPILKNVLNSIIAIRWGLTLKSRKLKWGYPTTKCMYQSRVRQCAEQPLDTHYFPASFEGEWPCVTRQPFWDNEKALIKRIHVERTVMEPHQVVPMETFF